MFENSIRFGTPVKFIFALLFLVAMITANPLFTIIALAFPPVAAKLLWKQNEPPVLFLGLLFQWLQVTIKVFYADALNVPFQTVHLYPAHINSTYILCIIALLVESIGIYLVTNNYRCLPLPKLTWVIKRYNITKTTLFYVAFSLSIPILLTYSRGGIIQFSYKIADLKWAAFFIFYCITFLKNTRKYNFYIILVIEIIISFGSYFSSFKDFFLFVAISYLTLRQRLKVSQYITLAVASVVLLNIMIIWQSVKSDYRAYLSGGIRAQVITVSRQDALNVLFYRVKTLNQADYKQGMQQLVERLSYIDFFSAVQSYVPEQLGYEDGRLWTDAVTRIFTPRFLFPNKSIIDDSEKTRKYTGLSFAGSEEGTSISLGYITESYIDFGPVFMFAPLFLFGIAIGWMYKYILQNTFSQLWGYACVIPIFFQIYTYELALDKAVGALFYYFIVYLIIRKFAIPVAERYISSRPTVSRIAYSPPQRII